jgi:hypothetical protein
MPSNDPQNDLERAAQQARDKVAAERARKDEEARKKAEAAALKTKQEEEAAQARRKQYLDLGGRFHNDFVVPLLRTFAQAQRVAFEGPTTEPPTPGGVPAHKSVVALQPPNQAKINITVATNLAEPAGLTGVFRSKDSVNVQVQAVTDVGGLKRALGMASLYDKSTSYVLGDFAGNQRLTVETWVRQRVTDLSAKVAEALARQTS